MLTKPQLWLLGISVGALIAILLSPETRSTARIEVSAISPISAARSKDQFSDQNERRIVNSHPRDVNLHIADLVLSADQSPSSDLKACETIENQFPDVPSVCAKVACQLSGGMPIEDQVELAALEDFGSGPDKPVTPLIESRIVAVASACKAGEACDSDNAFFPTVLAATEFASRDYVDANKALLRAGRDTKWDDYAANLTDGQIELSENAQGESSGMSMVTVKDASLSPQYAIIRSAARMAVWQAMRMELSDNVPGGIELRHAVMNIGLLMTVQSKQYIGSLVGIAIEHVAMDNPDGQRSPKTVNGGHQAGNAAESLYLKYLTQHRYFDEAAWVSKVLAQSYSLSHNKQFFNKLLSLDGNLIIVDACLTVAGWVLILWCLLALACCCVVYIFSQTRKLSEKQEPIASKYVRMSGALFAACLLLVLICWDCQTFPIANMMNAPNADSFDSTVISFATVFGPLAFFVMGSIVAAWKKRLVGRNVLLSNLRKTALPIMSVLLLIFCTVVVTLAREDNLLKQQCSEELSIGEGQYVAQLIGMQWPKIIPASNVTLPTLPDTHS